MKVPGTDWAVRTFQVTPHDAVVIRRGWKTAIATAPVALSAIPSEAARNLLTSFPDGLVLVVPPVVSAVGKRMRQGMPPEPYSSEAIALAALHADPPVAGVVPDETALQAAMLVPPPEPPAAETKPKTRRRRAA